MQAPWVGFLVPKIYGSEALWKRLRFRRKDEWLCIISNSEWKFPRVFDETMDFLKSKVASLLTNLSVLSQGLLVGFRIRSWRCGWL